MHTFRVELGARSYPIYIGPGLLGQPDVVAPHVGGRQVMIVTNTTVAPLYLTQTKAAFAAYDTHVVILPDGEQYKTLGTLQQIFDQLVDKRYERDCTLVALGGGVIGDLTGFAAACYQRGVPFIQIPTTLLAQVDSSVGGKTGVNHPHAKNMIGAFHQPRCVLAATDTLDSLDDRQLSAGIAEIIKYGLIRDTEFLIWLEANMEKLLARDSGALSFAIERSCHNKAQVVAADETESGLRATLNLGHTFGHAIEAASGYGAWLHGEAVATGMLMAADLSARLGWLSTAEVHRIESLLVLARLPTRAPAQMDYPTFMKYMSMDKKIQAGRLRLVLLKQLGEAVVTADYEAALLKACIDEHHALSNA
ncbi:MAG: 3-dehydroquinate synthase [Gammaproteobacteria bacterium]|nr:3-dehydroquinate synthase [Gammaproteobacteria bacterium]